MKMIIEMAGGLAMLVYGLHRMRHAVSAVTSNRFYSLSVGAVVTTLLQSSSATTVMLVGFTGAGIITITQAMGIILGADVGTTLTVQLISLKAADYSLVMLVIGTMMFFISKRKIFIYIGEAVMGFSFIFLGMKFMTDSTAPLKASPLLSAALVSVGREPVAGLLIGAVATLLLHTSAATIGIVLSFASAGLLDLNASIPIILGANIGTCSTAFLAAIGGNVNARRTAWAHLFFKVAGVMLVYPFMGGFIRLSAMTSDELVRQVANAHTIFNVGMAVVFLPLMGPGERLLRLFLPDEPEPASGMRTLYLSESALSTPSLAFAQASRELLRMADAVESMFIDYIYAVDKRDPDLLDDIEKRDDFVDFLDSEIKMYLTKISESTLHPELAMRELGLINFCNSLESAGDVISNDLVELARKKIFKDLTFSDDGWNEIRMFHGKVLDVFRMAVSAFAASDDDLARKVFQSKGEIKKLAEELGQAHVRRLHLGMAESIQTSNIHFDVLLNMERVSYLLTNAAVAIHNEKERGSVMLEKSPDNAL
jgi:phosphate:Na+ symporter